METLERIPTSKCSDLDGAITNLGNEMYVTIGHHGVIYTCRITKQKENLYNYLFIYYSKLLCRNQKEKKYFSGMLELQQRK